MKKIKPQLANLHGENGYNLMFSEQCTLVN